jgi:hypothetical protein
MRHHISPSMVVALIALAIALGGTAYAATQINGAQIKNGTITGKKLKKHTLTGTQVNVAKLGKVPSAASADHASTAGSASTAANATTLGGVGASEFVQGGGQIYTNGATEPESTSDKNVMTIPGLGVLSMGCNASGWTDFELSNATGDSVQASEAGDSFIQGSGEQSETNGKTAKPDQFLITEGVALTTAQFTETFVWPAGAPTHGAELNIGLFHDASTNTCDLNVTGFVH